jgi:Peptidase family M23
MSSKAEKTSHHSHQQPRLSIFFRNPLLLKIVAWLGSLSFIGSAGVVWADLKPISSTQSETHEIVQASVPAATSSGSSATKPEELEVYGPHQPIAPKQAPVLTTADKLPNREVPIAVTPASASISPAGTISRPQHTNVLSADNYTVGVNGSNSSPKIAEEFIDILVPAPLSATIPTKTREIATMTSSQVRPSYIKAQAAISQSVPTTSIQPKSKLEQSVNGYRSVPTVSQIPTVNATLSRVGRAGASIPLATPSTPLAGLRPTVVAPMKPVVKSPVTLTSATVPAEESIEISVPAPRTQRIVVQAVAQLPQVSGMKSVPTVPAIPSVRPAGMLNSGANSRPIAFVNTEATEFRSELIYPLSSPAPTTSSFGWRTHPITGSRRFHSGVDIGAPMGAPVVAAGTGFVISSGWNGGYGKAIVIQHNGVQQTLYGHLSEVFVQPGQRIEQGTVIGRVGSTGNSTGPHLHFEARVSTADGWVAVDPGEDIKYALDNLRRSMPFAQRDLPPGIN